MVEALNRLTDRLEQFAQSLNGCEGVKTESSYEQRNGSSVHIVEVDSAVRQARWGGHGRRSGADKQALCEKKWQSFITGIVGTQYDTIFKYVEAMESSGANDQKNPNRYSSTNAQAKIIQSQAQTAIEALRGAVEKGDVIPDEMEEMRAKSLIRRFEAINEAVLKIINPIKSSEKPTISDKPKNSAVEKYVNGANEQGTSGQSR